MNEKDSLDAITRRIIGAAIEVHTAVGPGLLESAYQACLSFELQDRGLRVEEQKALHIVYKEVNLDCGYRIDLIVENAVIIEIKAVEKLAPIHEAQLLSYVRVSGNKWGFSSTSTSAC